MVKGGKEQQLQEWDSRNDRELWKWRESLFFRYYISMLATPITFKSGGYVVGICVFYFIVYIIRKIQ